MNVREEFERTVRLLAEGKGGKWLRNRLYDLAVQLEREEDLGIPSVG